MAAYDGRRRFAARELGGSRVHGQVGGRGTGHQVDVAHGASLWVCHRPSPAPRPFVTRGWWGPVVAHAVSDPGGSDNPPLPPGRGWAAANSARCGGKRGAEASMRDGVVRAEPSLRPLARGTVQVAPGEPGHAQSYRAHRLLSLALFPQHLLGGLGCNTAAFDGRELDLPVELEDVAAHQDVAPDDASIRGSARRTGCGPGQCQAQRQGSERGIRRCSRRQRRRRRWPTERERCSARSTRDRARRPDLIVGHPPSARRRQRRRIEAYACHRPRSMTVSGHPSGDQAPDVVHAHRTTGDVVSDPVLVARAAEA